MLATNFGNYAQTVTKVGSQNFAYQIWFCTKLIIKKDGSNHNKVAVLVSAKF